jgi:hypothetical protein
MYQNLFHKITTKSHSSPLIIASNTATKFVKCRLFLINFKQISSSAHFKATFDNKMNTSDFENYQVINLNNYSLILNIFYLSSIIFLKKSIDKLNSLQAMPAIKMHSPSDLTRLRLSNTANMCKKLNLNVKI